MSLHLSTGSSKPPLNESLLRLYSMQFCPFAERARLVLIAKNVKHDVVNINLMQKPEWLTELNPKGLVPILDTGSRVISESLDICDYLNEQYPDPPLYSSDLDRVDEDKKIIDDFNTLIGLYYTTIRRREKSLQEYMNEMMPHLLKLEEILKGRGPFFGGDAPCMVDYMIWPWAERVKVIEHTYNEKLPVSELKLVCIYKWCTVMLTLQPVIQTVTSSQRLYKVSQFGNPGVVADYDAV